MFAEWLKKRVDFNDNDVSDLDEIAQALANFGEAASHAIGTIDVPHVVVQLRKTVEAGQAVCFYLSEIQKGIDKEAVEAATQELKAAGDKAWKLFQSFQPKK